MSKTLSVFNSYAFARANTPRSYNKKVNPRDNPLNTKQYFTEKHCSRGIWLISSVSVLSSFVYKSHGNNVAMTTLKLLATDYILEK